MDVLIGMAVAAGVYVVAQMAGYLFRLADDLREVGSADCGMDDLKDML